MADELEKQKTRFKMVKKRHSETYLKAKQEGKVDKQLISLWDAVLESTKFFSSSGCAGRILLLGLPKNATKKEAFFHRKFHRQVSLKEILEGIAENEKGELWFKQEPFILHIGCENISGARELLKAMRRAGIKRGGIMVAEQGKFIIECQGTQGMSLPVKKGKIQIVGKEAIEELVKEANKKLEKNYADLKQIEKEIRTSLEC